MSPPKGHPPYNKNGEGGRPLEWTIERIEKEAEAFEEWLKLPNSVYFRQFAISRGWPHRYLQVFSERSSRFRAVYEFAQDWQECRLVNGALFKKLDSSFTKLVLSNTVGWSDKQDTNLTGDVPSLLKEIADNFKDPVNEG